jgi:hypothetical protein
MWVFFPVETGKALGVEKLRCRPWWWCCTNKVDDKEHYRPKLHELPRRFFSQLLRPHGGIPPIKVQVHHFAALSPPKRTFITHMLMKYISFFVTAHKSIQSVTYMHALTCIDASTIHLIIYYKTSNHNLRLINLFKIFLSFGQISTIKQ